MKEGERYVRCANCGKYIDLEEDDTYYCLNGELVCEDCYEEETEKNWRRMYA